MSVERVVGNRRKTGRCVLVGDEKSGKSTILAETCAKLKGIIIDCDGGTDLLRDSDVVTYEVDTFGDVLNALKLAIAEKPTVIGIDDISVPYQKWTTYFEQKYTNGIPIHVWKTIKRPWFEFVHLVKGCGVPIIITSRIKYSFDTSSSDWKVDKDNWSAQAEKNFLYEMDIIIKTHKKDGRYYGTIDGARTKRTNEVLSALVGKEFENITFEEHIEPFFNAGNNGQAPEKVATEEEEENGHEELEESLLTENEKKQCAKLIAHIERGENKCVKIGAWEEIPKTRERYVLTNDLGKLPIETLHEYLKTLTNIVLTHKPKKEKK